MQHDSAIPLYQQLAAELEQSIAEGALRPGDKLPSENELCRAHKVSRITVRQTLGILAQKGLVYSVHGKGSFVKMPVIRQELTRIVRFSSSLAQKGLTGHTEVRAFVSAARQDRARETLGEDSCNLDLVGYAGNTPVVYYRSYFGPALGERMHAAAIALARTQTAFSSYDLYDRLQIRLQRVEQTIGAVNVTPELASVFGGEGQFALIVLETVYYGADGVPLEYKIGYYRADLYAFHLQRELD